MKLYTIIDWNEHFETAASRKLKRLPWVQLPTKWDGDGLTELLDHEDGAAHYGAWVSIVVVASKCKPRGTLIRGNKTPHNAKSLSRITRLDTACIQLMLDRVSGDGINWVSVSVCTTGTCEESATTIDPSATSIDCQSTDLPKTSPYIRGEERTLQDTTGEERRRNPSSPAGLRDLIESWNAITGLTPCRRATAKRIKAYATRSKDPEWASEMAEAIERLPRCKFLIGDNDRNWTADIDFFLRPDTVTKIIEGKYDHGTQAKQPANSSGTGHVNKRAALWEEMSRAAEARSAETPSPESIENTKAI